MADEESSEGWETPWLQLDFSGAEAEKVPPVYADATFVTHTADDFTIAFFRTTRPVLTPEQITSLKLLPAECVARVILPPRVAANLHKILGLMIEQKKKKDIGGQV